MQAQMLRSMLSNGLIRDVNPIVVVALTLLAALFWLGRFGWIKLAALVAFPFLMFQISAWQLGQGMYLPVGGILFSGAFAFIARLLYEGVQQVQKRQWLRATWCLSGWHWRSSLGLLRWSAETDERKCGHGHSCCHHHGATTEATGTINR